MAEYIKRMDTFSDEMCEGIDCGVCPFYKKAGENGCQVVAFLRSIPAADVWPVVRGKWEMTTLDDGYGEYQLYKCDKCGALTAQRRNFCPNCGADMREPPKEE